MASTSNNSSSSVFQFRYYGAKNPKNVPANTEWIGSDSNGGEVLDLLNSQGISAVKIGIQTLPGVKFYLSRLGGSGIIIDHTGVYELDLRNTTTTVSTLYFDPKSLARIEEIDNASIIVDVLSNSSTSSS